MDMSFRSRCLRLTGIAVALVAGFALNATGRAADSPDATREKIKPRVVLLHEAAPPIVHGVERLRRDLQRAGYAVEQVAIEKGSAESSALDLPAAPVAKATSPKASVGGSAAAPAPVCSAPFASAKTDCSRVVVRVQRPGESQLPAEGFALVRGAAGDASGGATIVEIIGGDTVGAMYGALDIAEQLRQGAALDRIDAKTAAPRFPFRAVKFNLPWMSYRRHESLQLHDETCRDLEFWRAFLDMMAENRFNTLTLWSLHPFTRMIRPKEFPEACAMSDEELDQWRHFWQSLFRMARDRGISTYIVNWNIFVSPEFARAHGVSPHSAREHFWGDGDRSELVARYTRQCVAQVIDEYPDLTGLGITLGEGMGGMTPEERRDWIDRAFVAGMKAAHRPARLIYRAPLSANTGSGGSTSEATEKLTRQAIERIDLPGPIWVEFKFNWSHAHSSPRLSIVHGGVLSDAYWNPPPKNYRITWMMRNEDFFLLRWGEPNFIRRHIALNGQEHVGGYFVGSECYIPAKDYLQRPDPRINWRYAFQRQWLFYMMWGRLLYDPTTPDAVFAHAFDERYGPGTGNVLLPAFAAVSRMPLRLASLHKATWDFTLYSEGFLAPKSAAGSKPWVDDSPFISLDELIHHEPLDPAYLSIADFARLKVCGEEIPAERITPPTLADDLTRDAEGALRRIAGLQQPAGPIDFELADVRAWAYLSLYFAEKIRGGTALQTFRLTRQTSERDRAVAHLRRAAEQWDALVETVRPFYAPVPLIHTDKAPFSWEAYTDRVRRDVTIAETADP